MNKRLFAICLYMLAGAVMAFAQNIDSQVEVERAYEGDIIVVSKSSLDTRINDSLLNFNLDFDYSTFYRPYNDLYELSSAVTASPLVEGNVRHQWLYADVSMAFPWTPKADVYIAPRLGNRVTALLSYNHYSYWGGVPYTPGLEGPVGGTPDMGSEKVTGDRMINRVGAVLAYRWRKGEVTAWGNYSSNYYAYNANAGMTREQIRDGLSQHFDLAQAAVNVRSTNPDPTAFFYDVLLKYNYFNQKRSIAASPVPVLSDVRDIRENSFDLDVSLGATIRTHHKVFFHGELNSDYYYWTEGDQAKIGYNGLIKGALGYRYEKNHMRIDARLPFRNQYLSVVSIIVPEFEIEYETVPSLLWLGAQIYNNVDMHSYYDIAVVNPWTDASCGGVETGEYGVKLGLRGAVKDRFVYSFNIGYECVDRALSFASEGMFQSLYPTNTSAHSLVMDASLKWQSEDFYAGVEAKYRYLSDRRVVLMAPEFGLKAAAEYNIRKRVFIAADVEYQTSSLGASVIKSAVPGGVTTNLWTFTVPGFVDLGVKVTYAVNHNISVYLEGNNLLNQKIQRIVNYYEPGVNVLAGVSLSF